MSKRRRKRKKRKGTGAARAAAAAAARPAAGVATKEGNAGGDAGPDASAAKPALVPWRTTVRSLLDGLRGFARAHHGAAIDEVLVREFGDPPNPPHPADLDRLTDDLICLPGSAGDGRSIAQVHAEAADDLPPLDRDQLRRWTTERRRGVFLVQRCFPDRVEAFDPLEGAGLTLHLLDRLSAGRAVEVPTGAVLTATYLPYVARLVAIGLVEIFTEPEARSLFREQVRQSGATWHDAPPTAPVRDA